MGCPVIGAAGGQFAGSHSQVKAALESGRIPVLLPDGGAVENPYVMRQYGKLAAMVPGLQVLWWEQWSKGQDVDEVTDEALAAARLITWEEFLKMSPELVREKIRHTNSDRSIYIGPDPSEQQAIDEETARIEQAQAIEGAIAQVLSLFGRRKRERVSTGVGFAPLPTLPDTDVVLVDSHEQGYQAGMNAGKRVLVNLTQTGGRKSSFNAKTTPAFWGTDRMITVLPDALNPTVEEYEEHALVSGRHHGTIIKNGKKVRATVETPESAKIESANCYAAHAIAQMAQKNTVSGAYQLACYTCKFGWRCGKEEDNNFGARYQAAQALKQPRIRMNYGRLHGQGDESSLISTSALLLDESSSNIQVTRTIKVSLDDMKDKVAQIALAEDEYLQQYITLIRVLMSDYWKGISGADPLYGIGQKHFQNELKVLLPPTDQAKLDELEGEEEELKAFGVINEERLTDAEVRRLNALDEKQYPTEEQLTELARLEGKTKPTREEHQRLRLYRKYTLTPAKEKERDELRARYERSRREPLSPSEMAARAKELNKRWLSEFVWVLNGDQPGYIHWERDGLTITVPETKHLSAIHSAQRVVLSDASERRTKAAIAKKYGVQEDEVFLFQVRQPKGARVEVVHITGLGKLGKNRGKGLEQCRQALVQKLKELDPTHQTFDWKAFGADGVLFRDTVGSNAYKHCQSISTTIPRPNINALLAEYCVIEATIVDTDDPGFQRFYRERVKEALVQTRGRLREQLRPGQNLNFYVMGDDELPIEGDRSVAASEITPEAARKGERAVFQIVEAAKWVIEQGQELTQSAVARATKILELREGKGYTQQYISDLWNRILECLQLFLGISNKKSCSPTKAQQDKVSDLIPVIEAIAQTGTPEELDDVILWLSPPEWKLVLDKLSDSAVQKLMQCWLSLLPESVRRVLA
ncbi:hypothetical protein NDI52_32295 [Leptolyngbya sp. PL-A3]|uniref:hypothetical protein n=1 Tax=Leptolyngbya sp. PL-A3 TaxID=2933911 RepID=UPI0032974944